MTPPKLNIDVKYTGLKIYTEHNTANIAYPLLITIPHAGRELPSSFVAQSGLTELQLRSNEDLYVDDLLAPLVAHKLPILSLNISRAFIDVNRDTLELDAKMFYDFPANQMAAENNRCRFGLGLIHRINADNLPLYQGLLSYQEVQTRIEKIYNVYHNRLQQLINKTIKKFGFCMILDCHSMPSKICGIIPDSPKIDCCLGNLFGKSCPQDLSDHLAQALTEKDFKISTNLPYSGAFTTFNYCQPRRKIYTLQLEINRGLYANEQKLTKTSSFQDVSEGICAAVMQLAKKMLDF